MFFVIGLIIACGGILIMLFSKMGEAGGGFIEKRLAMVRESRDNIIEDRTRELELKEMSYHKKLELAKDELEPMLGADWEKIMYALYKTDAKDDWVNAILMAKEGKVSWRRMGSFNRYHACSEKIPLEFKKTDGSIEKELTSRAVCVKIARRVEEILNSKNIKDAFGDPIIFKYVLVEHSPVLAPHFCFTFDNPPYSYIRLW